MALSLIHIFNPEDTTQITGYSVIKDSFTSDKNTSLVDDIRMRCV